MAKARSSSFLNEKVNAQSLTMEQHDQEFHIVHQKLDAVTSIYFRVTSSVVLTSILI